MTEYAKYNGTVLNPSTGEAVSGVSVTVKLAGTATLADLFSDELGTPTANPVSSNAYGKFSFYVVPGDFDLYLSGTGITPTTLSDVTIGNILLAGRSGGLDVYGSPDSGEDLHLYSNALNDGKIYFGANSVYDEANSSLGLGKTTPSSVARLDIVNPAGHGILLRTDINHHPIAWVTAVTPNNVRGMIAGGGNYWTTAEITCSGFFNATIDDDGNIVVVNWGQPTYAGFGGYYMGYFASDINGPTVILKATDLEDSVNLLALDSDDNINFILGKDGSVNTYKLLKSIGFAALQDLLQLMNTLVTNGGIDWRVRIGTPGASEGYLMFGRGDFGQIFDFALTDSGHFLCGSGKSFYLYGNSALRSFESGNTGIYTNSGLALGLWGAQQIDFWVAGAFAARMNPTGFGIGDDAPGEKLDVNGNINATGVLKIDDVQVVSNRVIDATIAGAIDSGDVTTDAIIEAMRTAMITHGLIAAA